jgi:hypothetical protein
LRPEIRTPPRYVHRFFHGTCPGTFCIGSSYLDPEDAMRAYLAKLTPKTRMLLAVPTLIIAYTLVTCVLPALVRAVLPDAVRSVLSLL